MLFTAADAYGLLVQSAPHFTHVCSYTLALLGRMPSSHSHRLHSHLIKSTIDVLHPFLRIKCKTGDNAECESSFRMCCASLTCSCSCVVLLLASACERTCVLRVWLDSFRFSSPFLDIRGDVNLHLTGLWTSMM